MRRLAETAEIDKCERFTEPTQIFRFALAINYPRLTSYGFKLLRSQILTRWSSPAVASVRLSGLKASCTRPWCACKVASSSPSATVHRRTVPSLLPAASSRPSLQMAIETTSSPPENDRINSERSSDQSFISLSPIREEASASPSGVNASCVTRNGVGSLISSPSSVPVFAFQNWMRPEVPVARISRCGAKATDKMLDELAATV